MEALLILKHRNTTSRPALVVCRILEINDHWLWIQNTEPMFDLRASACGACRRKRANDEKNTCLRYHILLRTCKLHRLALGRVLWRGQAYPATQRLHFATSLKNLEGMSNCLTMIYGRDPMEKAFNHPTNENIYLKPIVSRTSLYVFQYQCSNIIPAIFYWSTLTPIVFYWKHTTHGMLFSRVFNFTLRQPGAS